MSNHLFVAAFEAEDDVFAAVRSARAQNYAVQDVLTPYAVHGLDEAMGLRPSRLSYACLAFATLGLTFALWLQYWTSSVDWPLNVGGKPANSLPAFVPVAFELTVLFAGLGTVATLLARCRLFPGKRANLSDLRATDDRFVLLIAETDAAFDPARARRLFAAHHAVWCGELIDGHLHLIDQASGRLGEPAGTEVIVAPVDTDQDLHPHAGGHPRKRRVREMTGAAKD